MSSLRILIVDDEYDILEICKDAFGYEGHDVVTMLDPEKALKEIKSRDFDVVISDEKMPTLTGTELFYLMRKILPKDRFPSFFLSTGDFGIDIKHLKEEGMTDILIKPYDIDMLVDFVLQRTQKVA